MVEVNLLVTATAEAGDTLNVFNDPLQNTEDLSAAEENGEQPYEAEPQNQYTPQEEQDLYQTPEEPAAGGETSFVTFSLLSLLLVVLQMHNSLGFTVNYFSCTLY